MKSISNVVSPPSFCFVHPSVRTISVVYASVLVPQVFLLALLRDFSALLVIATAVLASCTAEYLDNRWRKRNTIHDGSIIICGLLIGFFCPETIPLPIVAVTVFLTVGAARCVFGGYGSCWINPAAAAVAVMYITAKDFFPQTLVSAAAVENAGSVFFPGQTVAAAHYDSAITDILNGSFLKLLGIRIPAGYVTLFTDMTSCIPAARFNLLTLAASVVLLSFSVIDWIVPAVFLTVYAVLVYFCSLTFVLDSYAAGDILFAVLSGGTLFTSFFLLSDASLLPVTRLFRIIYASIAGGVAFFLAGPGGSCPGMIFTVLVMNGLTPLMSSLESLMLLHRTARVHKWRQYESK